MCLNKKRNDARCDSELNESILIFIWTSDEHLSRKNSTIEQTVPISTKRKSAEGPTSYLTLRLCWSYDSERQAESSESASSTVLDESGKGGKSTSACAISHHKDALQKPGEGQLTADGNSLAGLIG